MFQPFPGISSSSSFPGPCLIVGFLTFACSPLEPFTWVWTVISGFDQRLPHPLVSLLFTFCVDIISTSSASGDMPQKHVIVDSIKGNLMQKWTKQTWFGHEKAFSWSYVKECFSEGVSWRHWEMFSLPCHICCLLSGPSGCGIINTLHVRVWCKCRTK